MQPADQVSILTCYEQYTEAENRNGHGRREYPMHDTLHELKTRLHEINDLDMAAGLLHRDQATYVKLYRKNQRISCRHPLHQPILLYRTNI